MSKPDRYQPITNPPVRRKRPGKRGRPPKGYEIDWHAIEAAYVTGTSALEALAEVHAVSRSAILERSRHEGWVQKRDDHRSRVQQVAKSIVQKDQGRTVADEIKQVAALSHGVQARLAQAIAARNMQPVTCPGCGHEHAVEIPRYDVSVSDLLGLLKARQILQGDPGYRPEVDDADAAELKRLENLSPDQVRAEVGEILRDAESYEIG